MGSKALRGRKNWQKASGKKGSKAELNFFEVLEKHFKKTISPHSGQIKELIRLRRLVVLDRN